MKKEMFIMMPGKPRTDMEGYWFLCRNLQVDSPKKIAGVFQGEFCVHVRARARQFSLQPEVISKSVPIYTHI